MAGTDCSEIGSGACPCGKGKISVECCTPDHPWARESQFTYPASLNCAECRNIYSLMEGSNRKPVLFKKADLSAKRDLEIAAQKARHDCNAHPDAKLLEAALQERVAMEKHYSGKHRILMHAGSHPGSLDSFRRSKGQYYFDATSAEKAMYFLDLDFPSLKTLCQSYSKARDALYAFNPKPVHTGINGMYA